MNTIQFVSYDKATGEIVKFGSCTESVLKLMQTDTVATIEGRCDDTYYVSNGVVLPYTTAELISKVTLPQGFAWKMPERIAIDTRTLASAQSQAWERIKATRTIKESLPFTCNNSVYDSNIPKISGAALSALMAQLSSTPFSIDWTLLDNTVKTLDASGMIAVGNAQASAINSVYETARTLRSAIQACTTNAQADAITWPT